MLKFKPVCSRFLVPLSFILLFILLLYRVPWLHFPQSRLHSSKYLARASFNAILVNLFSQVVGGPSWAFTTVPKYLSWEIFTEFFYSKNSNTLPR